MPFSQKRGSFLGVWGRLFSLIGRRKIYCLCTVVSILAVFAFHTLFDMLFMEGTKSDGSETGVYYKYHESTDQASRSEFEENCNAWGITRDLCQKYPNKHGTSVSYNIRIRINS